MVHVSCRNLGSDPTIAVIPCALALTLPHRGFLCVPLRSFGRLLPKTSDMLPNWEVDTY